MSAKIKHPAKKVHKPVFEPEKPSTSPADNKWGEQSFIDDNALDRYNESSAAE